MKSILSSIFFLVINLAISAQLFTDSNLPVVIIKTDGGSNIPNEPKILASMKIVWRGEGQRTSLSDQNNPLYLDYNGRIGIETRGSGSQTIPKKQYGFITLKADNVSNNNVSLLGMPKENDWILNGLAFDPSLIRDFLCYNLSRQIGRYSTRTVWCEVIINDVYKGLYILEEKIKQGPGRVDVLKIGSSDITFPKITGGYITKADKIDNEPVAWRMSSYLSANDVSFIHVFPQPEDITPAQNEYIKEEFLKLSKAAYLKDNSLLNGIPSIIDIASFVDYMILNEYSANTDAYQYSTFFHKERNGKLKAGPLWDQHLTFGNDVYQWGFDRSKVNTWQFANGDNEGASFWRDLFNNSMFRCQLRKRFNELTSEDQPLNYQVISAYIDKTVNQIREASVREGATWHTVGDLDAQVSKIKSFIQQRILWISSQLGANTCEYPDAPSLVINKIMYDPADNDPEFIEMKNTGSSQVDLTGMYLSNNSLVFQFPGGSMIGPGESRVITDDAAAFMSRYGYIPFGQYTRTLSDTGMVLILSDGYGNTIDKVSYSSGAPWPLASGNGKYLVLADEMTDNNDPQSWSASSDVLVSVGTSDEVSLRIYPNPVSLLAHISAGCIIDYLEIADNSGRVLFSIRPQTTEYNLDMSSFGPGMYFLRVASGGRTIIRKLIRE